MKRSASTASSTSRSGTERVLALGGRHARSLLGLAASVPFLLRLGKIVSQGVPDQLLVGDEASLELAVIEAARGARLIGLTSRMGWSHPGPSMFYLALPVYEAFGRRGPAITLFALLFSLVCGVALVLNVRHLFGNLVALATAALFGTFVAWGDSLALYPEWSPIFPLIPFALLSLLSVRLSLGEASALPWFVFLGSLAIHCHIVFLPEVVLLGALPVFVRVVRGEPLFERAAATKRAVLIALTLTAILWAPPVCEALTTRSGNLQQLMAFFLRSDPSEHTWKETVPLVLAHYAAGAVALARCTGAIATVLPTSGEIDFAAELFPRAVLGACILAALLAVLLLARRTRGTAPYLLAATVTAQIAAAFPIVRAAKGPIPAHIVLWASMVGLSSLIALTAFVVPALQRALGRTGARVSVTAFSLPMLGLALAGPVSTQQPFGKRNQGAERLASELERYAKGTRDAAGRQIVVRVASNDTWPYALAVLLHLHKRGIPVGIEPSRLWMAGKSFAVTLPNPRPLVFADRTFRNAGLERVAAWDRVLVYAPP